MHRNVRGVPHDRERECSRGIRRWCRDAARRDGGDDHKRNNRHDDQTLSRQHAKLRIIDLRG